MITQQVKSPTLIIDKSNCQKKIGHMVDKAKKSNVRFRPHFKTHQSLEIGRWFKDYGIDSITVSSLDMALYFSKEWDDITVAFPLNYLEHEKINQLASEITLNLLAVNVESIVQLQKYLKFDVGIFIEIDTGYHRTGIRIQKTDEIDKILEVLDQSTFLHFKGFLTHAGNTYNAKNIDEIRVIYCETEKQMDMLKEKYIFRYPKLELSGGDTPSCSIIEDFSSFDEIRPGNFVFYDMVQNQIGSCSKEEISVALAVPVVAIYPERNEIMVYGGGVHFSKDYYELYGTKLFGQVVRFTKTGWAILDGIYVTKLSQEHGTINAPSDFIESIKIGDILGVLPAHSCLTADLMKRYLTLEGEWLKKV